MSTHCNKFPGCGCPPECGERCHIADLGSPKTVGELLDKLNEIPLNADFGFRNQPMQTLHYDSIKVSCYFDNEDSKLIVKYPEIIKEHEEIAKNLIVEILYDNGYVDRFHTVESQISEKWIKKIAPVAGQFFDNHPDLLTMIHIANIASGGIIGDPDEDLDIIYKDYPDIKPLRDILNEYWDDGCGVSENDVKGDAL